MGLSLQSRSFNAGVWELVGAQELAAPGALEITGIDASYRALRVIVESRTAATGGVNVNVCMQLNGDTTGNNYDSYTEAVALNQGSITVNFEQAAGATTQLGFCDVLIHSNSSSNKLATGTYTNDNANQLGVVGGKWKSNSAITSVKVAAGTGLATALNAGSRIQVIGLRTLT